MDVDAQLLYPVSLLPYFSYVFFFSYNTQVSQRIVQTWQCALLVFIQPTKLQLCGSVGDASECLHTPEMPMFELTCPNMLQWRRPPAPTHGMLYYLPAWYFMISDQPMMDFGTGTNVNIWELKKIQMIYYLSLFLKGNSELPQIYFLAFLYCISCYLCRYSISVTYNYKCVLTIWCYIT